MELHLKETTISGASVDYVDVAEEEPVTDAMSRQEAATDTELSIVIALRDPSRMLPLRTLYSEYKQQIDRTGLHYEFVFVLDGDYDELFHELTRLKSEGEPVRIIKFAKSHGDSTALLAGFDHSHGDVLMTLPANFEIDPKAIPELFEALETSDMVIVNRSPRTDSWLNRVSTSTFHFILKKMVGYELNDITCGVRLFRRAVTDRVRIYGDQHRFLPILVRRFGFKVKEVEIPQYKGEAPRGHFSLAAYIQRGLDLFSIFFLVKFTKKPLRFFGVTGLAVFALGAALSAVLATQRLFMDKALADRPALLLAVLLIVLGVQLFALGIIGELIIFTHGRQVREYTIERIVN